jgi:hypothetical protein
VSQQLSTINYSDFLDSCIQIEEIQINRKTSIPHKINFVIDFTALKYIEKIINSDALGAGVANRQLFLSASKIANLRYYVVLNALVEQRLLLNPTGKERLWMFQWHSSLTFSTNYLFSNRQRSKTLFRSAIDLNGTISQQIQQDLYQNPQLLTRISQVHYWLISQILVQLPLRNRDKYPWFVFGCSSILATLFGLTSYYLLPLNRLFSLTVFLTALLSFNTIFKQALIEQLKRWIIYHLIEGFLAQNATTRQVGVRLLSSIA